MSDENAIYEAVKAALNGNSDKLSHLWNACLDSYEREMFLKNAEAVWSALIEKRSAPAKAEARR
jgi:hypothetical protein